MAILVSVKAVFRVGRNKYSGNNYDPIKDAGWEKDKAYVLCFCEVMIYGSVFCM